MKARPTRPSLSTLLSVSGLIVGVIALAQNVPRFVREVAPVVLLASLLGVVWALLDWALTPNKTKPSAYRTLQRWAPRMKKPSFALALIAAIWVVPEVRSWYVPPRPILVLADSLRLNEELRAFQLHVANKGAAGLIDISILRLQGGEQRHDDFIPLKLGSVPLSRQEPLNIPLLFVDRKEDVLKVPGNGLLRYMKIHSTAGDILPASLCVRVAVINVDIFEERAFRLIPDKNQPNLYRSELTSRSCQ